MNRVLVVNADDFGRAANINAGVAAAHEKGIVSSASLMVRWPDAAAAADYARAHPSLSLGLHVDVGEWAYQDGGWCRVYDVVAEDDEAALEHEVLRQLDTFRALCGIEPTHLDSHQHAHRHEPLGGVLRRLAADLNVPLRHVGSVRTHTGFYGQTSKGFSAHDRISVAALVSWLHELPEGVTELVCHPAASDEVAGSYRGERVIEVSTLCDPAVRSAIARNGIALRSFREVSSGAVVAPEGATSEATSEATLGTTAVEAAPTAAPQVVADPNAVDPAAADDVATATQGATRGDWSGTAAAALWERGALRAACREIDAVLETGATDASLRHWRDLAEGDVRVLSGAWSGGLAARPVVPVQGRILHVVGASLPYGQTGYSLRTAYVTQAQQRVGLDPHVVTPLGFPKGRGVPSGGREEPVGGVPHHRLPTSHGIPERLDARLGLTVQLVADLAARLQPAVIHAASDYQNALVALEVGRAIGVPVVYEVRGFWEETQRAMRGPDWASSEVYRWRRERERQCYGAAQRIVTLADVMKGALVERGVPGEKIDVIPNAVDVAEFVPVARDSELAARFGIATHEVVLGYISSLTAYEGVSYLIEAIGHLARRGCQVRGVIVGDGTERDTLMARVAALGLVDRVTFAGRVSHDDIHRYHGLIDIFVVPRTADRVCQLVTPMKPFEAMATARAVVVSRVGALEEIVEEGVTGLTFASEDALDLANVVEPLIRNADRRLALGQAARHWVSEHRTWRHVGERYRRLYESMGVARPTSSLTKVSAVTR